MLRSLFALALLGAAVLVPVQAQVYTIQPRPMTVDNKPKGGFSLSMRVGGATNVTFEGVGTIAPLQALEDATSLLQRAYNDGFVGLDSRSGAGAGTSAGDDGYTNRWLYTYASQQTANGDIAFHQYATTSSGNTVSAESGSAQGIDMQYDYVLGVGGRKVTERAWAYTWGLMAGGVFSPVNASTRSTVVANLVTVTDTYSLDGAVVPAPGYVAPSTTTVTDVDANGNPITRSVDNTTLIGNRPYSRVESLTPIDVTGYWQVKGAYYSFRVGPWFRWQMSRHLSLRASVGATYSFLGLKMEHDELVDAEDLESLNILRGGALTSPDKHERFGVYGAVDAEWWLSDRTGFFIGATYESTGEDVRLTSGGRTAVIELPNGTGFRAGISVLF